MTIGECIRTARIAAGMTQTELAEATDIPYQTIGHWERDSTSPKYNSVEKIAQALGITVADLIAPNRCQPDSSVTTQSLFAQIDEALRKTEESDIETYHAWMRVAPMVQKILSEEFAVATPGIRRKPMSSEAKRRWLRINDSIEKVTNYIVDCEIAGREIHPNVEDGLDAMLQLRRQMVTEYELE